VTVDDVVAFVTASTQCTVVPTKAGVVFRNERRIIGSAKPGRGCVRGHLVLPRAVEGDERITKAEPLTKHLWFNGFRLDAAAQLDESFGRLVLEAARV
jgi:hypothetical protein